MEKLREAFCEKTGPDLGGAGCPVVGCPVEKIDSFPARFLRRE